MPYKVKIDEDELIAAYRKAGSFRGAAKLLSENRVKNLSHMSVQTRLNAIHAANEKVREHNIEDREKNKGRNQKELPYPDFHGFIEKTSNDKSNGPEWKVYIRPEQYKALDRLAAYRNRQMGDAMANYHVNKHIVARELLDQAIARMYEGWSCIPQFGIDADEKEEQMQHNEILMKNQLAA